MFVSWSGPSQEMQRFADQCIQNLSKLLGLRYKQSGSSDFTSNDEPKQDLYKDLVNALQAQVTLQDMKREWSSWLQNHGFIEELLQHDKPQSSETQQHETQPQSGHSQPTYQQQSQHLHQNSKQPEYQQSQYLYQEQPSKLHNALQQSENQPPRQHLQQPQYTQSYQNHLQPQYFHQQYPQQPQYSQQYQYHLQQQQYTQQQQPAAAIWSAEQQLSYIPTAGTSQQARPKGPGHSRNRGKGTQTK
ncbi:hypothetical protein V8F33_013459 [Rhypophila sp. PSN 637]